MSLSRKQTALLHVAKRGMGLTDEAYRDILQAEAGCRSAKDLDTCGMEAVMRRFEALGFSSSPQTAGVRLRRPAGHGHRGAARAHGHAVGPLERRQGRRDRLSAVAPAHLQGLRRPVPDLRPGAEGDRRPPGHDGEAGREAACPPPTA